MCGIAVAVDTRGRGRAQPWASDLMRHRGPDGEAVIEEANGQFAFEHCRLAIIDPDNPDASQPFTDPSGRWVLVYNGEVFNFRALRRALERRGALFRTDSDTEVVLQSFLLQGEQAVRTFRGMFAFVIFDRETGELFAARDHIGVKPLYWSMKDGLFIAASELRTMLGNPAVSHELDPAAVIEYLAFGHTAGERTLIEGVQKLPPGHVLRIRDGQAELFEYWDTLPPGPEGDSSSFEQDLLDRVEAAVSAALVSDVPVSLMLSGGLDSSLIASLAARHVDPARLTAYSVSFGLPTDESDAARRLATELGLRHREIHLTRDVLEGDFDAWLATMDLPSANPTWVAVRHIARAVREDGGKVLLSGDGGDELFGGYDRWMTYLRFNDRVWGRTPASLRRLAGSVASPFARGLAADIARRARDGGELFVGSRPFHDDDLASCLGPVGQEAAVAHPPERPVEELRKRFMQRFPDGDYLAWISYVAVNTHLVEDYLARLDKMAMQQSVEGRVPLLDPPLAEWAFSLPQARKTPGFEQKALFRRAATHVLPPYITGRPKQGFCPPVVDWASSLMAERVGGESSLVEQGLIAPGAVDRLKGSSTGRSFALWTLGTLVAWCDRYL